MSSLPVSFSTLAVVLSPFVVPRLWRTIRPIVFPSPGGTRTPLASPFPFPHPPPLPRPTSPSRLLIVSLGVSLSLCLALLTPPPNLFLDLAPASSLLERVFPTLRQPLDIRTPTESLKTRWLGRNGGDLSDAQRALLLVLQTLDARIAYAASGAGPLLGCTWCRSPSSGGSLDFVLYNLPAIALGYLTVLGAVGLLTAGPRGKWRKWGVWAMLGAGVAELYTRLSMVPMRGNAVVMLHSNCHVLRHLFFAAILLAAFLSPPDEIPDPRLASSATYIGPALASLASENENLVNRLRAISLQRMALLHHHPTREQIMAFWTQAEEESGLARKDPAVQALRTGGPPEEDEAFQAWLEHSLTVRRPRGEPTAAGEEAEG